MLNFLSCKYYKGLKQQKWPSVPHKGIGNCAIRQTVTRKRYKIDAYFLQMSNRMSYAFYRMVILLVTSGNGNSPAKLPIPLMMTTPSKNTYLLTDPTHHPKRHPDPISCFATILFLDHQTNTHTHRQTHRLTIRWDRRQLNSMSAYAHYIYSDALISLTT